MVCDLACWIEILAQHSGSLFFVLNQIPYRFAGLLETCFVGILISKQETFIFEVFDELRSGLSIAVWAYC